MKKYFVVNLESGQKYGPADVPTLNVWLREGRLTAQSTLEDAETSERLIASMVPGLDLAPQAPSAPPGGEFQSPYPRPVAGSGRFAQFPPGVYFELIGKSWDYIKPNIGMFVVSMIIFIMLSGLISYPFSFAAQIVGMGGMMGTEMVNPFGFFAISGLGYLVQFAFSGLLTAGMISFCLDVVDGKPADISAMFRPFKNTPQNIIASLAHYMLMVIGFLCCIVPGIYLFGRLMFVNVLVTEQGMSAQDALKECWEKLAPFAWSLFALYFVAAIIGVLGMCACFVGFLVTMPFLYVTLAQHFRIIFPQSAVNATDSIG